MNTTSSAATLLEEAKLALQGGDTADADRLARRCLDTSRSNPTAHHILALSAIQQSDFKAAIAHCEAALRRKKSAAFYQDLAYCQIAIGDPQAALLPARKAANKSPRDSNVLNLLGAALEQTGQPAEAVKVLEQAIAIDPTSQQVAGNLVRVYLQLGDAQKAANAAARQLELNFSPIAGAQFVDCLSKAPEPHVIPRVNELLLWATRSDCVRAVDLCPQILRVLEADSDTRSILVRISNQWPAVSPDKDIISEPAIARLVRDPLFLQALQLAPLPSPHWEKFLTALRHAAAKRFFEDLSKSRDTDRTIITLLTALAEQSALNEYVHAMTPYEAELVNTLVDSVRLHRATATDTIRAGVLSMLSCFGPLRLFDLGEPLGEHDFANESEILKARQLELPVRVTAAMERVPLLTDLDDRTASVRAQYEADPYPFWLRSPQCSPLSIEQQIENSTGRPLTRALPPGEPRQILIAGCGTGQQSTEAANLCPNAEVLAIDLSRTSLGFAAMRTEDHGITNITYAQADILALKLDRKFHYIESTGVLHHLPDPVAGWKVLREHLMPGGVMRIALYSSTARKPLGLVKSYLAAEGLNSANSLLAARQHILLQSGAPWDVITGSKDFYSRNGVRDLIFHECEHQFTLPEIDQITKSLNLQFLGLNTPPAYRAAFAEMFPDPAAATNFEAWDAFEQAHPSAFASMYEFYLQCPHSS